MKCLQYEALFFNFPEILTPKGISVTCVATAQPQSGEEKYTIPPKLPVFQTCEFHVIFLIYFFSLVIDDITMKRILLRLKSVLYPIVHVFS